MEKTIEGGKLLLQMWREGNYMKHRAKRLAKIKAKKEAVREDFIRGQVGSLSSMAKPLEQAEKQAIVVQQHHQQYQEDLRSSLYGIGEGWRMELAQILNRREEEPKQITHIRYLGKCSSYFTAGEVYEVTEHNTFKHCKSQFIRVRSNDSSFKRCYKIVNDEGLCNINGEFELIYNNNIQK